MTKKYVGEIRYSDGNIIMPTCTVIPDKQEWGKHAVFSFNGKRWNTLTPLAEANVLDIVSKIQAEGKTAATKDGKRKPTSIKYAILTTGIEPFYFI